MMAQAPHRLLLVLSLSALTLFTACAPKIPFTQSVRDKYQLTESELQSIQFYTSHDIVLQRGERNGAEKGTEEGKLTVKSGQKLERVVIKAGTPGVVEKVMPGNRLAVSFEVGDNTYLVFGPARQLNGSYTMLAKEWKNDRGRLQYGNNYYITNQGADRVYLTFRMRQLNRLEKEQRVVSGRKL